MLYQLRMPDGGVSDYSSGSIVDINGEVEHLNNSDFSVEVHDYWTSPKTAIRYPSRWTLRIPKKDISMTITPTLPEQEMLTKRSAGISYWEGRCLVSGTQYDNKLSGNAYVELVGYKK
jgi:predicted secreted hydrolase